jgi:hypothetical protein
VEGSERRWREESVGERKREETEGRVSRWKGEEMREEKWDEIDKIKILNIDDI